MTIWKTIEKFPMYEVSNEGQVRRKTTAKGTVAGKVLAIHKQTSTGYPDVRMRANGKAHAITLHNLVTSAFLGPKPKGMQVRHLDGNKMNNHLNNLVYGTPKENGQDKVLHGNSLKGEKSYTAKLTEEDVVYIYNCKDKVSAKELAKQFPVSKATIYKIWRHALWSYLTIKVHSKFNNGLCCEQQADSKRTSVPSTDQRAALLSL